MTSFGKDLWKRIWLIRNHQNHLFIYLNENRIPRGSLKINLDDTRNWPWHLMKADTLLSMYEYYNAMQNCRRVFYECEGFDQLCWQAMFNSMLGYRKIDKFNQRRVSTKDMAKLSCQELKRYHHGHWPLENTLITRISIAMWYFFFIHFTLYCVICWSENKLVLMIFSGILMAVSKHVPHYGILR